MVLAWLSTWIIEQTGCVDAGAGGVIQLVLCIILYAVVTYTLYICACVTE